jgi:Carboxypeptidase regulatory-like domain
MTNQKARFAVLVGSLICLFSPLLQSQATGSFSGTVSDNSGAVVSGAIVTVTAQATNVSRDAITDATGHFLVPLLGVADYTIKVHIQGFKASEVKDVRLQIDEHRELDFKLVPASVSTSVEVNATEVAIETTTPTLGQVITSQEVAELPLNGRNFVQLATLTPGTTASTSPVSFFTNAASSEAATRGSFSLSVGGSREQETDWMLDGNDNNQLDEGGIAIFSSLDDIEEFKVLTYNYSAEYGERAGPTVLVTTKSGSNKFHGSLFEYFRNTKLDADPFFGTSPQKFNLNQFGGSLGGAIKKDKTFFFLDYQAKMQREGVTFTGFVPTAAMITPDPNGNYNESSNPLSITTLTNPYPYINPVTNTSTTYPFICSAATGLPVTPNPTGSMFGAGSQGPDTQPGVTDCPIIPGSLINPIGARVAQLYPAPDVTNNSGFNYINEPVRKLNEGTWDIRLDHNFSNKDSAFGRFSYDQATNYVPGGSPTWSEAGAFGSNQFINNHGRNAVVTETHIFSPTLINQATVGYSRIFNHILSYGTGTCEAATLGIPGADLGAKCDSITGYPASLNQSNKDCESCGMTSFQMSSYFSVGDRGYAPYQGGTNVYSAGDVLDLIRGKHNIRFGATYRAEEMNVRNNAFQDGYVVEAGLATGDDIADLLLGSLGVFAAHDQTFLGATTGRRWKLVRPFVQDDWRMTNNVTVNIGLAWSLATPETEAENRQANFNIQNLKWYVPTGSPTLSSCTVCIATDGRVGIQFDKTALEPRIGLSWKPMGSDKTAVRLGYGIFHDSAWNQGGQGLWQNPPYYAEVDPFPTGVCTPFGTPGCGLSNGFLVNGSPLLGPQNPSAYTGTIQSANLNFKQGAVQQFNVNVERQLPGNIVLTAGYAGSRSHHILVSQENENLNQPSACGVVSGYTLGCGFGTFPYAGFYQTVASNDSIGNARYDSLEVKAETKSTKHGLYALFGYTWSRTFDSGMPDGLGTNPGAIYWPLPGTSKLDWGLSQLNLNDSFTASILYDLPFGKGKHFGGDWSGATNAILGNWHLDLIERATSGFPLFVVDSADESGTYFSYNGFTLQRPNEVGNPNEAGPVAGNPTCTAPAQIHTLQNWFNPCAFEKAPAGELGTAARAPVYGPRFVNTDFSVIKNFPFHEGMNVQFRAEFFNLFNHPQFYMDGLGDSGQQDINTPSSFGVLNNTVNNPRLVQFALRLAF